VATQSARRPASQRPSAERTTHSTESEQLGLLDEPQRPAHRLQLELEPAGALLPPDEPRGEPVVRGRAALLSAAIARSAASCWWAAGS
jgi:hypothetical protein